MEFINAKTSDAKQISRLMQTTISSIDNTYSKDKLLSWKKTNTIKKWEEAIKKETVLVIKEDKEIIGVGSVYKNEITSLYIHPKYQSKNLGSKLLNKLEKLIKSKEIVLTASLNSVNFYLKHAYQKNKKFNLNFSDVEIEVVKMTKIL